MTPELQAIEQELAEAFDSYHVAADEFGKHQQSNLCDKLTLSRLERYVWWHMGRLNGLKYARGVLVTGGKRKDD